VFFPNYLQWLILLKPCPIKDFSKCDFTPIFNYLQQQKEIKKAMTKEEKLVLYCILQCLFSLNIRFRSSKRRSSRLMKNTAGQLWTVEKKRLGISGSNRQVSSEVVEATLKRENSRYQISVYALVFLIHVMLLVFSYPINGCLFSNA
jgi:hypothetical protein